MTRRSTFVALVLLAGILAAPAADASRRSSLAGNLIFEDVKDIFIFPHEVTQYVNHVWFDFVTGNVSLPGLPGSVGTGDPHLGSGGLLVGNAISRNFGLGVATHRADYQGALWDATAGLGFLGDFLSLLANTAFENAQSAWSGGQGFEGLHAPNLDALNWLDLLLGFEVSPVLDMGVRVSLGHNLEARQDLDGDNEGDLDPGGSATSFDILGSVGYGAEDDPFYMDAALELTFASYGSEWLEGDDQYADEGSAFGLTVFGRGFINMSESIDLGLMAELGYRSRSTALDDPGDTRFEMAGSNLMIHLAAGPRYEITDEATVGAYATLGVMQETIDPEGRNNVQDELIFILPGINIAGEFQIKRWFAYRAGLVSYYALISGEDQEDTDEGGSGTADRDLFFYWSNGIGFNALDGDFTFDCMLNWPIITGGPNILSGNQADMFAMVTAGYTF